MTSASTVTRPESDGTLRRERRRARARRALCEAAVELFSRDGYEATSAEAIAHAADYSERTFFRHFARKEDVIFYDLPERLVSLRADIEAADGDQSAWRVVRSTLVANASRWETEDRELSLARVRLFHTQPTLEARYLEICLDWEDAVAEILAAERSCDPYSDLVCRLIASASIGGFRAAFRSWLAEPSRGLAAELTSALDHLEGQLVS